MKIIVVSDSHGRVGSLLEAVEREMPDRMFHLGDLIRDAQELQSVYPDIPMDAVEGNCDGWSVQKHDLEVTVGGLRFFLTHGHFYQAKFGPGALLQEGRARGVDAVCYGHTHEPVAQLQPDGLWLINPGTVGGIHNRATYGVLTVEDGTLDVQIKPL